MRVLSYNYIIPNNQGLVEGLDRQGYMSTQYIEMMEEYLKTIELKGRVAVLYAAGAVLPASEARNTEDKGLYRERAKPSGLCIRELAAYGMHRWIGSIKGKENVRYANVNGNTCASSMHSIYEAEKLLAEGYDEVLIISEEKTSYNTLRIFDEHNIDLKVGEACVIMHVTKGDDITDCKWEYEYNRNPFGTTVSGYSRVMSECDYVNPHGTGTENNEAAENEVYGNITQVRYKEMYGHTQGVSGLLEVCLVLESGLDNVLCVSSGLGGYYGSCIVHKQR